MEFIKATTLKTDFLTRRPNGIPIIFFEPSSRIIRKLSDTGYQEFSLNKELAQRLMTIPEVERSEKAYSMLQEIIEKKPDALLITNFEMLFDPRYKIDAVKLFCEMARQRRIVVTWCGSACDTYMEYAEPGSPDYRRYEFNKYTLYCVK